MMSFVFASVAVVVTSPSNVRQIEAFCLTFSFNVRRQDASTCLAASNNHDPVVVAMTREEGKNDKLRKQIEIESTRLKQPLSLLELPCIAHASGPDYDQLSTALTSQSWDYVVVTSPESANVLASAWDASCQDKVPAVVAVGIATEKVLAKNNIPVSFVPSKATAETLVQEMELVTGQDTTTVLYPASARAQTTLQDGLSQRGFAVTRLNTYDTVTATWTEEQTRLAQTVQVACFASPSSIKGWLHNTNNNHQVMAACIGSTSATACQKHGWKDEHIFYPEAPGIEGWVESIQDAMTAARQLSHDNVAATTADTTV
ncbi:uroporphyrinogen-III synthase [Nitzschia inconspicua]|uniref:Uroporphyrinogen-III synthase n=1 Tax=Nitzschia inconspicua TaxID=303405 RepID=A0A9K3LNJ3_9STRA|nr:uroporphyrinogen-III synthase [Nitzschia inconspicua]